MTQIVLASESPRRRALLSALGLTFAVKHSGVAETCGEAPAEDVVVNARAKRDDVASTLETPAVVIAADTLVVLGGRALGKPADKTEARCMLEQLSGLTHQVMTGVAVIDTATGQSDEDIEITNVTFRTLAPEEIDLFIEAVNPVDRAGAYTVDGPGSLLVERFCGCYQNVLGLPMVCLDRCLRRIGHRLIDLMDVRRVAFL